MTIDNHPIKHAVEVGAGDAQSSRLLPYAFIERVTLIEPNTILATSLAEAAQVYRNVLVYPVAAGREQGQADLIHMGYGSFIKGAPAFLPLGCEPNCEDFWAPLTKSVPVMTLAEVEQERGPIDLLVLTANGYELLVVAGMTSRPICIRTAFYIHNERQGTWAHQLMRWLDGNGYRAHQLLERNEHGTYQYIDYRRVTV